MKLLRVLASAAVAAGLSRTPALTQDNLRAAFIPGIASDPFF